MHTALGYPSWGAYWAAEFGGGKSHGYRQLEAARVRKSLPDSRMGNDPDEDAGSELARLKGKQAQENAWDEATGRAKEEGARLRPRMLSRCVDARLPKSHPTPKRQAGIEQPPPNPGVKEASRSEHVEPCESDSEQATDPLTAFLATCERVTRVALSLEIEVAARNAPGDAKGWADTFTTSTTALNQLIELTYNGQKGRAASAPASTLQGERLSQVATDRPRCLVDGKLTHLDCAGGGPVR